MLEAMTSRLVTEWMAYELVAGPLGPGRADLQAAIISATVANANRGKKGRRAHPKDFIPTWDRKPAMGWEEQLAAVKTMNRAMGGADLTKEARRGDPGEPAGAARRRQ